MKKRESLPPPHPEDMEQARSIKELCPDMAMPVEELAAQLRKSREEREQSLEWRLDTAENADEINRLNAEIEKRYDGIDREILQTALRERERELGLGPPVRKPHALRRFWWGIEDVVRKPDTWVLVWFFGSFVIAGILVLFDKYFGGLENYLPAWAIYPIALFLAAPWVGAVLFAIYAAFEAIVRRNMGIAKKMVTITFLVISLSAITFFWVRSFLPPGKAPLTEWACPDSHPIKGELWIDPESRERLLIHFSPRDAFYKEAKPSRCFAYREEAELAYYRRLVDEVKSTRSTTLDEMRRAYKNDPSLSEEQRALRLRRLEKEEEWNIKRARALRKYIDLLKTRSEVTKNRGPIGKIPRKPDLVGFFEQRSSKAALLTLEPSMGWRQYG